MKKTYIMTMPDSAGSLLQVSRIVESEGGNIDRIDYQKAVDLHTLFLDIEASREELKNITQRFNELGLLYNPNPESEVILVELKLPDKKGSLCPILEIINDYGVNISYIDSQNKDMPYQHFRMGLYVENPEIAKALLEALSSVCEVELLDYSVTKKILDSTVFYMSFANEMRDLLKLNANETNQFIAESNKIMQFLESQNETPFKTFKYIRKFAKFVVNHKDEKFNPIIREKQLTPMVHAFIIEPPCGSNIYILDDSKELLFIDGGFQCYVEQTKKIIKELIPDVEKRHRHMILTHADIDHTGLTSWFDEVWVSENCRDNLEKDYEGEDNFREQNPFHAPYCRLSKLITGYTPLNPSIYKSVGKKTDDCVLSKIGTLCFGDLNFMLFEGNGGHVKGETILFDPDNKVIFTGDNFVNIKGFSDDQRIFNTLAPYLMTSVNMDSQEATRCRQVLLKWTQGCFVCPGHGMWEQR